MKNYFSKGFSLIELIIVIAIMAILVAAIVPALIRYIDKSRTTVDTDSCDEVARAVTNELVADDIDTFAPGAAASAKFTVTVTKNGTTFIGTENLLNGESHVKDVCNGLGINLDSSSGTTYFSSDLKTKSDHTYYEKDTTDASKQGFKVELNHDGTVKKYCYYNK